MNAFFRLPNTGIKSVIRKSIALLAILAIGLSISTAQQLQIRRETTFGSLGGDLGEHSVFVNSKSQVVVFGMRDCDSCNLDEMRINFFDLQLGRQIPISISFNSRWYKGGDIIEAADGGYVMIGSLSTAPIDAPNFDSDILIAKLSATGTLVWERRFTATGNEEGVGVQQTADGGYLIIANSTGNNDITQNTTGKKQIWLAKLDANGNTTWSKLLTTQYNNTATDFKKTEDGNFIISGGTRDNTPFGSNASRGDALLMKFNDQGTILWQSHIGGNSDEEQFDKVTQDYMGNFFVSGYTRSTNLPGQTNRGGTDGWVTKVSNAGTVLSMKLLGGTGDDRLNAIAVYASGIVTAGGSTFSHDGDVIENVKNHTVWVTSYQDGSNEVRHGFFGHTADNPSFVEDIALDASGNVFCVGTVGGGVEFIADPVYDTNIWLLSLGETNKIKVAVYIDANNNGIKDADEDHYNDGRLEITKENISEYFSASSGAFNAPIDTGNHVFRFLSNQPYYTATPAQFAAHFPTYDMDDSFTVRLVPNSMLTDLAVRLLPLNKPRPGFEVSYQVTVTNLGAVAVDRPLVKLVRDPRLTILSASPAFSASSNDTLTWDFSSRSLKDTLHILFTARLAAPPETEIGDKLISQVSVSYDQEDATPLNNSFVLTEIATGSFDPNDKNELHGGVFPVDLLTTDKLHYLIRFQNTGTDTTFNVVIRDTLHEALDISGFQMLTASHPYTMTIKNGRHLEWKFNNVLLPDSNVNEKASQGFLTFSIKPKASLKIEDVITNKASIYFDYNLPIVTNTTSTRIVNLAALLPEPVLSGLKTSYCGNETAQTITITNIVAAHPATITVKINGTAVNLDNSGNFLFEPAKLNAGNQNIEITFSNGSIQKKLAVNFTITTPIKPVVKLNTNTTVVDKNTTILQLTAIASAAGNGALYSFAKDRGMLNILQPESSSNILALPAVSLNVGDNWIYVQMKSADECVTSATALDSVKIIRTAVTAIVDVDYPNSTIIAYPTPFTSNLTIQGLQPASFYSIQMLDASGRIVVSKDVKNQTTYQFLNLNLRHGAYYIRLYDKKKKRLIGSMKVLKLE